MANHLLFSLLQHFGIWQKSPVILPCDNQPSIHIPKKNPVLHKITIYWGFTREKDCNWKVRSKSCWIRNQLGDLFTKALPSFMIKGFISNMNITNIYIHVLRGSVKILRKQSILTEENNTRSVIWCKMEDKYFVLSE